jgi:putative PIN family toxin of toxin-antitoxin system
MASLRVVLDTNVLVSALAYPAGIPGLILAACQLGSLDLVLSRYILDEMVRVLPRLKRIKLKPSEIRDLADSFMFLAEIVEHSTVLEPSLRDTADQPVLGTLLAGNCDYLITGDKDLARARRHIPNPQSGCFLGTPRPVNHNLRFNAPLARKGSAAADPTAGGRWYHRR